MATDNAASIWRTARLVASLVVLMTAAYYYLVAFDNITNPQSNWAFIQGVLSGDGVNEAAGAGFEWHYIDNETFQLVGYITVIACETLTGILLLIGGFTGLFRTRDDVAWAAAQKWTYFGGFLGLGVFFFGFLTVGGNWFIMYLNEKWNGMEPAFQNSVMTITMLILVTGVLVGSQVGSALKDTESASETA